MMARAANAWRRFAALGIVLLAVACGGGGGGGATQSPPPPAATEVRTLSLASAHTNATYTLSIYTPPGYAADRAMHPVIYATDAEFQFALIPPIVEKHALDAIVVGISYISSDRRFVDYVLPGAEAYYRFLTLELIPFIEAQYRVDRTRRTLTGFSLSGSFVAIAMFLEDPGNRYFSAVVSSDGSFWNQTVSIYELEQRMFDTSHDLPVALFLGAADNVQSINFMNERLAARGYRGFRLREQFYGQGHIGMLPYSLDEGLAFAFGR